MQEMKETQVQSLGQEDPLDRKCHPTPIFLPGKVPWTEDPGRLQPIGSQTVRHDWVTEHTKVIRSSNIPVVVMKVAQSCPNVQSMEFSRQNTGVVSCSLLQGIFPTQRSNPGLPHYRLILYQLSYQGNLIFLYITTKSVSQKSWRSCRS